MTRRRIQAELRKALVSKTVRNRLAAARALASRVRDRDRKGLNAKVARTLKERTRKRGKANSRVESGQAAARDRRPANRLVGVRALREGRRAALRETSLRAVADSKSSGRGGPCPRRGLLLVNPTHNRNY
jgi:hypothetical protein